MSSKKLKNILFALPLLTVAVFLASPAHAQAMEPIQGVLMQEGGVGHSIRVVWNSFLSFANSIMVIALLIIAFSNILHIQLDKYAIKKILPSLIIAIVLANFSYFICRFIIDIGNMILNFVLMSGGGSADQMRTSVFLTAPEIPKPGPDFWGKAWSSLLAQLGQIVGAVFIGILSYLFFIRNWVIYFLVALSPLGFVSMAIPQGKTLFDTWWKQFIQWVFMPVVASFWLWVGAQFLVSIGSNAGATMSFVFALACFYFAFTTPFKMGGAIMKGWGGFGKKLTSPITGAAGAGGGLIKNRYIDPFIGEYKNKLQTWYQRTAGRTDGVGKTIGWQARRARRSKLYRAEIAKGVETSSNQMDREALGGKFDQFGNYENNAFIQKYTDLMKYNASELGESEWAHKDLETQFHRLGMQFNDARQKYMEKENIDGYEFDRRLEAGDIKELKGKDEKGNEIDVLKYRKNYRDLAHSKQYADRMEATDSEEKSYRNTIAALSNSLINGVYNSALEFVDPELQKQQIKELRRKKPGMSYDEAEKESKGQHYKEMALRRKNWETALRETERMNVKRQGDTGNLNVTSSFPLHNMLSERDQAYHKLQAIDVLEKDGADKEACDLAREHWNQALEDLGIRFAGHVDKLKKDYWDEDAGEWQSDAGTIREMLGPKGEHMDFRSAKSQHEVYHIPNELKELFDTRARKEYSVIVKNEIAASAGKRETVEALGKIDSEWKDFKGMVMNRQYGDVPGDIIRQFIGELSNAITKAGGPGTATYATAHKWMNAQLADAGAESFAAGVPARQDLAVRFARAIETAGNSEPARKAAENALVSRGISRATHGAEGYNSVLAQEIVKASTSHVTMSPEQSAVVHKLASTSQIDSRGQLQVKIDVNKDWGAEDTIAQDSNGQTMVDSSGNNVLAYQQNTRDAAAFLDALLNAGDIRGPSKDLLRGFDAGAKERNIVGREAGNHVTSQNNLGNTVQQNVRAEYEGATGERAALGKEVEDIVKKSNEMGKNTSLAD